MSGVQTLRVGEDEGDQRLDRWLRKRFPQLNQIAIEKMCRKGELRIDGGRVKAATRIAPGQEVRVPPLPEPGPAAERSERPLGPRVTDSDAEMIQAAVLWKDEHIIAINKPPGLPSQGGSGQGDRHVDGLAGALMFGFKDKPKLVHRLDKDTSGVLLLARTDTLAAVRAHAGPERGAALPESGAFLLVQADGAGAEADGEAMAALMRAHGGDVTVTVDPAEGEALMALRRTAFPALERLGTPLVEDVAVPRSRMAEMFARIREIEARTGVAIPTTAHAGDGNLHPILLFGAAAQVGGAAEDAASIPADVWEAAGELFRAGLELGGTLTGEHGVGLLKRAFLRDELGDAQHDLQQRIKAVFDPHGILNPGKVFTP